MGVSWDNSLRLSIVHFVLYPNVQLGQGSISEKATGLAEDDFFPVLEANWVKDRAVRRVVRDVAESAHFSLSYRAQPALLSQRLDINSLDDKEDCRAIRQVKSCIDEAAELGATRLTLVAGSDPGDTRRDIATCLLVDSLKEIWGYGEQRGVEITRGTFDRESEKKSLVGPSRESAALAPTIRKAHRDFGILYDMARAPLLDEGPRKAFAVLNDYSVHIGNCVKVPGHVACSDKHPRFGIEEGQHDVDELAELLRILFDVGYLGNQKGAKR